MLRTEARSLVSDRVTETSELTGRAREEALECESRVRHARDLLNCLDSERLAEMSQLTQRTREETLECVALRSALISFQHSEGVAAIARSFAMGTLVSILEQSQQAEAFAKHSLAEAQAAMSAQADLGQRDIWRSEFEALLATLHGEQQAHASVLAERSQVEAQAAKSAQAALGQLDIWHSGAKVCLPHCTASSRRTHLPSQSVRRQRLRLRSLRRQL